MPIRSDAIGMELAGPDFLVTPRAMLSFAAAIGDDTVLCCDDEQPGFMAHPTFCVRPEWLLMAARRNDAMGISAEEARRVVHAGQATRFLRPIRAGMQIRPAAEIIGIRNTRAGALVSTRIVLHEYGSGETLSSTVSDALYRGIAAEGEGGGVPNVFARAGEDAPPSAACFEETRLSLDPMFAHRYTECADIWNPIHTERRVARAAGLPDILVHGTALWALAGREIIRRYAPGAPFRLASLSCRFSAMVFAGEPIVVRHAKRGAADGAMVAFSVVNIRGEEALSDGIAVLL